jgi:hypothetical protein
VWWAGLLIASGGVGGVGLFESAYPLALKCPDVLKVSRKALLRGFLGFAAYGAGWFGVLLAVKYPTQLQFGGHPPPDLGVGLFTIAAAQTGRIEGPRAAQILGSPRPAADRESFYAKGVRYVQVRLYVQMLRKTQHPALRLAMGLNAVYDYTTLATQFETWATTESTEPEVDVPFYEGTRDSTQFSDEAKRNTLILQLIARSQHTAIFLAEQRAAGIIDRRAF